MMPMDDREIARRAHLRSRVMVTMKVRVNPPADHQPNESLTAKQLRWALIRHYALTWALILTAAWGATMAMVRLHQ
jgi:hypothetical protein